MAAASVAFFLVTTPISTFAAVSLGGVMAYSPDDISGFTTLTGDDNTASITLPFTCTVEGTNYTTIVLSTNGWIEFGSNTPGGADFNNDCLPTSAHINPFLAAYWDDLNPFGTAVRYGTVGASPNRVFIADFEADLVSGAEGSDDLRFQIQLHERSDLITVKFRDSQNNANGQGATVGFQGAGGSCGGASIPGCGDHYVGYKIKAPKKDAHGNEIIGNAFPRDWVITIDDILLSGADDPENFVVKKEKTLLVEAVKNVEPGPFAPGLRYLRYQMKLGGESVAPAAPDGRFPKPPKHVLRNWSLDNQFGTIKVLSKKVTAVLVPAAAHLSTPPAAA